MIHKEVEFLKRQMSKIAFFLTLLFCSNGAHSEEKLPVPVSIKNVELKADPKKVPSELEGIGVSEHLGRQIQLDTYEFISVEDGKKHKLSEYFEEGKPTLLNLVYYECPMLCTMVLNGVLEGMKGLSWSIGKEFNVVTISINPNDPVNTAKLKKSAYLQSYLEKDQPDKKRDLSLAQKGWSFFTGDEIQIKRLSDELGFLFRYDSIQKEYAHPAVTFVLTPNGFISRYLYGIQYHPRDLKLALLEASKGKIGNVFDRLLMFCYHYEPSSRGYTLQVVRVMQAGAAGTVALLGGYLFLFWRSQGRRRRSEMVTGKEKN